MAVYVKTNNNWRGSVQLQGKYYHTQPCKIEDETYELYKILLAKLGIVNYNEK